VLAATTVPQWIAAIGGSLSLLIAFRILLRDRYRAVASQAEQIACWRREQMLSYTPDDAVDEYDEEAVLLHDEVHVHNTSERPITNVGYHCRPMSRPEVRRTFSEAELQRFKASPAYGALTNVGVGLLEPESPTVPGALMPGESAVHDFADPDRGEQFQRRWVHFRDSNGVGWLRDLADGQLLRTGSPRARYRLRRGWVRHTLRGRGRDTFHWWEHA
jgi:hypothetical protein